MDKAMKSFDNAPIPAFKDMPMDDFDFIDERFRQFIMGNAPVEQIAIRHALGGRAGLDGRCRLPAVQ